MIHMMVDTGWRKVVIKESLKSGVDINVTVSLIEVQTAAEKNQCPGLDLA